MRFSVERVTATPVLIRLAVLGLSTWAAAEFAQAIELPKTVGALGGAALAGLAVWLETRAAISTRCSTPP